VLAAPTRPASPSSASSLASTPIPALPSTANSSDRDNAAAFSARFAEAGATPSVQCAEPVLLSGAPASSQSDKPTSTPLETSSTMYAARKLDRKSTSDRCRQLQIGVMPPFDPLALVRPLRVFPLFLIVFREPLRWPSRRTSRSGNWLARYIAGFLLLSAGLILMAPSSPVCSPNGSLCGPWSSLGLEPSSTSKRQKDEIPRGVRAKFPFSQNELGELK